MNTSQNAPLAGRRAHTGPGGRGCACCNEAPGKARRRARRYAKRAERQAFRRSIS